MSWNRYFGCYLGFGISLLSNSLCLATFRIASPRHTNTHGHAYTHYCDIESAQYLAVYFSDVISVAGKQFLFLSLLSFSSFLSLCFSPSFLPLSPSLSLYLLLLLSRPVIMPILAQDSLVYNIVSNGCALLLNLGECC